jgi:hypothetical protein
MEPNGESPQPTKPDAVWMRLLMVLLTGLIGAASSDLWASVKAAVRWVMSTG